MQFAKTVALFLLPLLASAGVIAESSINASEGVLGGPAKCTLSPSGRGEIWATATKDCCAAVRHKAYYNEYEGSCMGYGGFADNAVDHGAFGKCCDQRGGGSHGYVLVPTFSS
jgi:hypothetical protein